MSKIEQDEFFWQDRNVFVTGASGFLGTSVTQALVAKRANVISLVRDKVSGSGLFRSGLSDRITTVHGALEDYATVNRSIAEYEIDTVFHIAAQAIVGVANRNPMSTFEANIQGTWHVLEACRQNPTVKRVVNTVLFSQFR